jgi:hypothetical protein
MNATDATKDLTAIGVLAGRYRVTVQRLERLALRFGMPPAMKLNNVAYYDAMQCEAILDALKQPEAADVRDDDDIGDAGGNDGGNDGGDD